MIHDIASILLMASFGWVYYRLVILKTKIEKETQALHDLRQEVRQDLDTLLARKIHIRF